ncbi:MAG: hypothetical protein MJE77_16185 [Proteobacteria bacterium]|nr:hypothetical protein [Pseudomonadota bacterium]
MTSTETGRAGAAGPFHSGLVDHGRAEAPRHDPIVKPAKILITASGRAKLTDFDLVAAADTARE